MEDEEDEVLSGRGDDRDVWIGDGGWVTLGRPNLPIGNGK